MPYAPSVFAVMPVFGVESRPYHSPVSTLSADADFEAVVDLPRVLLDGVLAAFAIREW